ncbi:hypothetical protein [Prevotella heparinolytica]|nr:hypothetical protein [Bacteroides heparinolyticus]
MIAIDDGNMFCYRADAINVLNIDGNKKVSYHLEGWKYSKYSFSKLIRRLVRAEVTGYYKFADGNTIVVAKKGLFKLRDNVTFARVFNIPKGSKPLNLCILPNGHVFFGEYFQNLDKTAVNVYGSYNKGDTWEVVYTFESGNINHIHGLFYDKYTGRMWYLTGDRENECVIGYTEDEFKTVHEVFRGGQEYRSCQLFFYKDFIVYATDSQYVENEIKRIDRETLEVTSLFKIQGSAIKGGQVECVSYLSTTIEPSKVNKDRFSHIWVTKDGEKWQEVFKAEKDCWPAIFQFGTFEFPQNAYCDGKLWFSGRALKGYDGKSSYIEI